MSWGSDRGETVEDKLDRKISKIENDLSRGRYGACWRIPGGIALRGKPEIQSRASALRSRCSQRGIGGWLMANKFIVIIGAITTASILFVLH